MYVRTKKGWKPDDFSHEQSVVIDTDKGLVIINSCSHGGAVNIINEVKETGIDYVCTGHCTMNRAYHILKDILGDKLEQLQVGKIIEI